MTYQTITVEADARGVATLWLDRADKHNALSAQMIAEIGAATRALAQDDAVRVVVLGARGRSFCAGGDLAWMRAQFAAPPAEQAVEAGHLARMLQGLNALPKPLIGRVQGNCFGGGLGMVSVCDVAVGTGAVQMALTETRLGLIPATVGPYVVARMGEARARRVFFSGRRFDAEEARTLGLLARVVPEEALDAAVEEEVAPYLDCAPGAVAQAKALVQRLGGANDQALIDHSIDELVRCWQGAEAQHGITAFLEKRKPRWQS
ncbi:crotonase/enoyl-CoA hydratase family protein [Pseudooceanicola sediminis]|uniref:Crotonase/enoyl-CoA hydratase family protein n=1 Tax=Pseudooceanicola sediminis TaxID=2211117 RepID=A0A399J1R9_9RHOB|nr:crotonase/enoyl-CoA hydratase family protein [Pseudooceanicola sediminis]KAA2316181.1 crotonase/enoyl-CoA hydratase family protein [Puniceibacterium sp. HSS470]RII39275.1 crotonase/enoyl-CoA hydratase family protein [Pseudooceanicola sediminis]|tara:strand:- start:83771 stop:84556 length:786 start_codon:yes stop_codon:yes gene_type:complete